MPSFQPTDFSRIKFYPVSARSSKVCSTEQASLPPAGCSARDLFNSFPNILGAASFKKIVQAIVTSVKSHNLVIAAFGAHVIKTGCASVLNDLMRRGIVHGIACNGACAIHDVEMTLYGSTSEEVAETLQDGSFGMVTETMEFFKSAVDMCKEQPIGLGRAIGELIKQRTDAWETSVFATACDLDLPATVHVALGTDTIHVCPDLDADGLGRASMYDFRLVCDVVSKMNHGVWLNIGSAVVLPEVFLKAVSVARNLGSDLSEMSTANFDMIKHYRPHQNVITRPVKEGNGHEVVGHHEIMLPLLRQAVLEELLTKSIRYNPK